MAGHYTYLDHVIPPVSETAADTQKLVAGLGVAAVLILIGALLRGRLQGDKKIEQELVPNKRLTLFGFFDVFIEIFIKYHDSVLGKENRHHVPFTGSLFLFIFFSNLIGLIPGMPAITTSVWINWGMALVVLVYFTVVGMRTQGVVNYWKHFFGPSGLPLALAIVMPFLMFSIEFLSVMFLRPFVLNLRLYWNITADHIVLHTFTDLLNNILPGLAFPFYFIGTFVSFMQAFVFTTLTMIYILLAVQHDEEH